MTEDDLEDQHARWQYLLRCRRCNAGAGAPCVALSNRGGIRKGQPIKFPHNYRPSSKPPGRVADQDRIDRCMAEWKRLCARQLPVGSIAEALRLKPDTLARMVIRARQKGHPDAVYHPAARFRVDQPTQRQRNSRRYHRERRETDARERAERDAHLRRWFVQDSEQDETEE